MKFVKFRTLAVHSNAILAKYPIESSPPLFLIDEEEQD